MRRTPLVTALALGALSGALWAAPVTAQHGGLNLNAEVDDGSGGGAAGSLASVLADGVDDEPQYDEFDEYDEFEDEGFCGDGEETSYDEAYFAFEADDYEGARDILVAALRDEELYDDRAAYLILLGQAQLRLNDIRHATVNFNRTVAADAGGYYTQGARVGLAVAALRNGQRRRAQALAGHYVDDACAATAPASVSCYIAHVVLATSARDPETRAKGQSEARRVRSELDEYERPALAYYDTTFDVAGWPAPVAATPEVGMSAAREANEANETNEANEAGATLASLVESSAER